MQEPKRNIQEIVAELWEQFHRSCGTRARIYRVPGRVDFIGVHAEYIDGFVMPVAIDFCVAVGHRTTFAQMSFLAFELFN